MKKVFFIVMSVALLANNLYANEELSAILNDMKEPPAFKYIPRDDKGRLDWQLAVEKGVIRPIGKINSNERENPLLNLDVKFKGEKGTEHGVVFSHKIHTYYFNCEVCHTDFTFKEKNENRHVTMLELKEGKSCGQCHGKVAFNLNECDRCHNKTDLPEEHVVSLK